MEIVREVKYNDFIKEKKFSENNIILNEKDYDILSYIDEKELTIINLSSSIYAVKILGKKGSDISCVKINEECKYYYDYYFDFDKDADIIDNIKINSNYINIKIILIIGTKEYKINEIKEILLFALNELIKYKLRILFNEIPDETKKIIISMRKKILKLSDKEILQKNKIICDNYNYHYKNNEL